MGSKDTRNLIIALIILAVGTKLIAGVAKSLIAKAGTTVGISIIDIEGFVNLILIGIIFLIIILIPVYLSKRSEEK